MTTITKDPAIDGYVEYDFSTVLSAQAITSIVSITITPSGQLTGSQATINGNVVQVYMSGDLDGQTYATSVQALRTDGDEIEVDGVILSMAPVLTVVPPIAPPVVIPVDSGMCQCTDVSGVLYTPYIPYTPC